MNIVSVQIYSDPNTPWNRSKIDFPINIQDTNWPGNGCGLCNQIFKLINTMACNNENDIYLLTAKKLTIDKFIGLEGSTFSLILNYLIEYKKSIILK